MSKSEPVTAISIGTDQSMSEFLADVARHKSGKTHVLYAKALKDARGFLPDLFEELRPQHMRAWQAARLDKLVLHGTRKTNPNTVDTMLTALKAWCRWVVEQYDLDWNPADRVRYLQKPGSRTFRRRILDEKEYAKIIEAAGKLRQGAKEFNREAQDAMLWLANTGLRGCEFRRLSWDCFLEDPTLQMFKIKGKGGKVRYVPCDNNVCQAILARYQGQPDFPFVTRFGQKETKLNDLCKMIGRKAGVKRFGPHALRHYYATQMIDAGVPVKKVSLILGHSSTIITENVYTHLKAKDLLGQSTVLNNRGQ